MTQVAEKVVSTPNSPADNPISISKKQYKTLFGAATGYTLDGMDMMLLSFALPLLATYFHLSGAELGFIATITLFGAVIGGIGFGLLADKYGRVRVFSWTILLFSIFTALGALAPNIELFTASRFIAGLGLGGEFGIGMTLVVESWSARHRSKATAIVAIGFQIGIVLASLITLYVAPHYGWRGLFLVGGLPALFVWWVRRHLEESPVWLAQKARNDKAGKRYNAAANIKSLFSNKRITMTSIGLIIASSVQNFGFYGIMTWMPMALAKEHGFALSGTTLWTVLTISGMILGTLFFGAFCDKVGRRPAFITFLLISACSVWLYFSQTDYMVLLLLGSVMGFFVNGTMGGFGAILAEHYPTEVRATAQNMVFNLGRAIAGFAPLTIGFMADKYSFSTALMLLSSVYLISALSFIFLIPETKGKALS